MRLVISRDCFVIERVPRGIDLSDLRAFCGVSWDGRRRRFAAPLRDARMLERDLERRGVRLTDDVVRAAALSALEHDLHDGPSRIALYGDARALPELSRALDDYRQGECAATDFLTVVGLATAIDVLGGETTQAQRGKVAEFERLQRSLWADGGAGVLARLGEVAPLATFGITLADESEAPERTRH